MNATRPVSCYGSPLCGRSVTTRQSISEEFIARFNPKRNSRVFKSAKRYPKAMNSPTIDRVVSDDKETSILVDDALAWCSQHGLVYSAGLADVPVAIVPAPISLLPVSYPRETFLLAKRAATAFNSMIDAVSCDDDYLTQVLAAAAKHDDFTAKLLKIHASTTEARIKRRLLGKEVALAINRSDYMLHAPTSSLLQVELNTIASSFGCLSTLIGRMHRYLMQRCGATESGLESLPPNDAMTEIASALGAAIDAHTNTGEEPGVVIMVVQPGERNAFDQQWLQLRLWELKKIRTVRKTLAEIAHQGQVDPSSGTLTIDGHKASVVYFRAGYTPNDYYSDAEWHARELIETSNVVACPSISLQLAGSKKVQQDLANPGVVEKFASTPEDAKLMRTFFAGLWGLDSLHNDAAARVAVEDAISNPGAYVLKPQREGGGNNLYGEELKEKLVKGGELGDLILMQRILPPVNKSIMVRLGKATQIDTLSELGVYGTYLRKGENILLNKEAGHLVRTKAATSDEGGVAAGYAVLDSPFLVT